MPALRLYIPVIQWTPVTVNASIPLKQTVIYWALFLGVVKYTVQSHSHKSGMGYCSELC